MSSGPSWDNSIKTILYYLNVTVVFRRFAFISSREEVSLFLCPRGEPLVLVFAEASLYIVYLCEVGEYHFYVFWGKPLFCYVKQIHALPPLFPDISLLSRCCPWMSVQSHAVEDEAQATTRLPLLHSPSQLGLHIQLSLSHQFSLGLMLLLNFCLLLWLFSQLKLQHQLHLLLSLPLISQSGVLPLQISIIFQQQDVQQVCWGANHFYI